MFKPTPDMLIMRVISAWSGQPISEILGELPGDQDIIDGFQDAEAEIEKIIAERIETLEGERITGVAFLLQSGMILVLPAPNRHHDIIRASSDVGLPQDAICDADQGFITSTGRYVTREDAVPIAQAAGQILQKTDPAHMLFSEDLW